MSEQQGSESIYRAPESETSVAPAGDQMAAFVGPRYESFYADKFAKFERGANASWNWPAFFLTAFWLLYRKMWAYGLSYWFLLPLVLATFAGIVAALMSDAGSALIAFNAIYYGLYSIISLIIIPMYANRLYYRHAQKKLARAAIRFPSPDQQSIELARAGGTSNVILIIIPVVLVALLGIIAAISIPAYQDYTVRAQVAEGLNLASGARAAVTEYYHDSGGMPADNMTAGLEPPRNISGTYVSSVQVENGRIIVTYGKTRTASSTVTRWFTRLKTLAIRSIGIVTAIRSGTSIYRPHVARRALCSRRGPAVAARAVAPVNPAAAP